MADHRTGRRRQPQEYPTPETPSTRDQHQQITEALAAAGFDRAGRLFFISAILGRRIPAYGAMSLTDAAAVLAAIETGPGPDTTQGSEPS